MVLWSILEIYRQRLYSVLTSDHIDDENSFQKVLSRSRQFSGICQYSRISFFQNKTSYRTERYVVSVAFEIRNRIMKSLQNRCSVYSYITQLVTHLFFSRVNFLFLHGCKRKSICDNDFQSFLLYGEEIKKSISRTIRFSSIPCKFWLEMNSVANV